VTKFVLSSLITDGKFPVSGLMSC